MSQQESMGQLGLAQDPLNGLAQRAANTQSLQQLTGIVCQATAQLDVEAPVDSPRLHSIIAISQPAYHMCAAAGQQQALQAQASSTDAAAVADRAALQPALAALLSKCAKWLSKNSSMNMDTMLLDHAVAVVLAAADNVLFDQQLLAAIGGTAFDAMADSMREALKNITAVAGQQVALHLAAALAGDSSGLHACQLLLLKLVQGHSTLVKRTTLALASPGPKEICTQKNFNATVRAATELLCLKGSDLHARLMVVSDGLVFAAAQMSIRSFAESVQQLASQRSTETKEGRDRARAQCSFLLGQYSKLAKEYIQAYYRTMWPDLWACTLQLHHMMDSGALDSDLAEARKWTDKLVVFVGSVLAAAANQMASPCEEQMEACAAEVMLLLADVTSDCQTGTQLTTHMGLVIQLLNNLAPGQALLPGVFIAAARLLMPWLLKAVCVTLYDQSLQGFEAGTSPVPAQSTLLWQAVDACLALLLALPMHQAAVEGVMGGGPWTPLYNTAASTMFGSLCQLSTSEHPLMAQVANDIMCCALQSADPGTASRLLTSLLHLLSAITPSEALAAAHTSHCGQPQPAPLCAPLSFAVSNLLGQAVKVSDVMVVSHLVHENSLHSSHVDSLSSAALAALVWQGMGALPGVFTPQQLAQRLVALAEQAKDAQNLLPYAAQVPEAVQQVSSHLSWVLYGMTVTATQLMQSTNDAGALEAVQIANSAALSVLRATPSRGGVTEPQSGSTGAHGRSQQPATTGPHISSAWQFLALTCRALKDDTLHSLMGAPAESALQDPLSAPHAATLVIYAAGQLPAPPLKAMHVMLAAAASMGHPALLHEALSALAKCMDAISRRPNGGVLIEQASAAFPAWMHEKAPTNWMLLSRIMSSAPMPHGVEQLSQHIYQQADPATLLRSDGGRLAQKAQEAQLQAVAGAPSSRAALVAGQRAVAAVQEVQRTAVPSASGRSGPLGPRDAYTNAKERLSEMHKHWGAVKEALAQMVQLQVHATADGLACRRWVDEVRRDVGELCSSITGGMADLKL